jgi:hypothetical protein
MSPTSTALNRRVGRKLALSAAAVAVCLLPTACNFGGVPSSGGGYGAPSGDDGGNDGGTVVVPVGNQHPSGGNGNHGGQGGGQQGGGNQGGGQGGGNQGGGQQGGGQGGGQQGGGQGGGNQGGGATPPTTAPPTTTPPADGGAGGGAGDGGDDGGDQGGTPGLPVNPFAEQYASQLPPVINGQQTEGVSCEQINEARNAAGEAPLDFHQGFQITGAACVPTAMGAVAAQDQLPSLLITAAPKTVGVGQGFQLKVSTRNLVRDRFLGAAAGGYYLESSVLDGAGLQRGHFHTACRILPNTDEAPDSSGTPEFFLATQDNGGAKTPDTVTIDVPATATAKAGTMQCTSWAGDGSHRTPMMSKANQTPAVDSVRIEVGGAAADDNAGAAADDNAGAAADDNGAAAGDAAAGDNGAAAGDNGAAAGDAAADDNGAAAGDAAADDNGAAAGDAAAADDANAAAATGGNGNNRRGGNG